LSIVNKDLKYYKFKFQIYFKYIMDKLKTKGQKDGKASFTKSKNAFNPTDQKDKQRQKSSDTSQAAAVAYESENPYSVSKGRPKSGDRFQPQLDSVSNGNAKFASLGEIDRQKFQSVDAGSIAAEGDLPID
jgi:hypothetical protein